MHNAVVIANEIIKTAKEKRLSLSAIKLNCLLFLANAQHLAHTRLERSIFSDEFIFGYVAVPTIPSIMYLMRYVDDISEIRTALQSEYCLSETDIEEKNTIATTMRIYGAWTDVQLIACISHNTPIVEKGKYMLFSKEDFRTFMEKVIRQNKENNHDNRTN